MAAKTKTKVKRRARKKNPNWDSLLLQTPWKEIAECCDHYRLQRSRDEVIQVTRAFLQGYPAKPKPPKEAYHQAKVCADSVMKLGRDLGRGIRECRENAALVVLGHSEDNFHEIMFRLRLNDPVRTLLWWRYRSVLEKAESAKTVLLEAIRDFREIGSQELRGRPAHIVFDTWVDGLYSIWRHHRSERISYNKKRYWGESLEFLARVLNIVKPLLKTSVRETLPSGISEEASSEIDQKEINAIGHVVHTLTRRSNRRKRKKRMKIMANNTSR